MPNPCSPAILRESLDALSEPVAIIDKSGVCLFTNARFAELLGAAVEGCQGETFWPEMWSMLRHSGEATTAFQVSGGTPIAVHIDRVVGEATVVRVLASRDASDTRLFHGQRLELLGILAGSVAHDFNNVLTGILGHVTYLKSVLSESQNAAESLQAIEDGAVKATAMTQQIVQFSKVDTGQQPVKVNLCDLVQRTCSLLRGALPSESHLYVTVSKESLSVLGHEARIAQVLMNLVINSRDALLQGGSIWVSLESTHDESVLASILDISEVPATAYSVIVVRDDGHGMTPEIQARIFEPFFSTKASAGTGVGLATVKGIVKGLGGAITVQSAPGAGTEFRVYLPQLGASHHAGPARGIGAEAWRGSGERILVVDDEPAVRNVLSLSLEHLGYRIEAVASGLEALESIAERGPFDLVLLDMLMPGMSGEETFNKLRKLVPQLKVLLISGFSSEQSVRNILQAGGRDYIQKPFTMEVLSKKVHGCLHEQ